jgi:GTP cyclohydrolase I
MAKKNVFDEANEAVVYDLIKAIGDYPEREGLKDTPKRVVKMWKEIFRGYDEKQKPKITVFDNGMDGINYDQMICDTGDYYSHCEHHMVTFFGKYYFAYIPSMKGKILGLSKVARVVDYFSAKLQVQERLTHEIVDYIWNTLCDKNVCKWPPLAMGLVMEGEHLCKTMRGVKKKGTMRTTILKGTFQSDPAARAEFLDWVNKN